MYSAELPEQLICEKTGHRSEAVREYKRTSNIQKQEASDVVQGLKRKSESAKKVIRVDQNLLKLKMEIFPLKILSCDSGLIEYVW